MRRIRQFATVERIVAGYDRWAIAARRLLFLQILVILCCTLSCKRRPTSNLSAPPSSELNAGEAAVVIQDGEPEGSVGQSRLAAVPGFGSKRFAGTVERILDRVEPNPEVWRSEVLAAAVQKQLQKISLHLKKAGETSVSALTTHGFQCSPLRPPTDQAYADNGLQVFRQMANIESAVPEHTDLAQALSTLQLKKKALSDVHFKIHHIHMKTARDFETELLFESHQENGKLVIQQDSTWNVHWKRSDELSPPKIHRIAVTDFRETICPQAFGFQDVTNAVLGQSESFREQLSYGVDYWRGRLEANYGVDPNGNQGLALGDVNGDGLDDLFICQQGGLPNRLYLQQPDGQLVDISSAAGVDWMEPCRSALFVDLDNDGDQDLVMAQGWYLMIMSNDGRARFRIVLQQKTQANLHSVTAADYDSDGAIDLFICGRNPAREQTRSEGILGTPIPYHDANNGGPNLLLRNEGGLRFKDVTIEEGLDVNNRRYSYAAAWEDFDNDGDMDLYVANDFGRNNLYRNNSKETQKPRFVDVAAEMGVEDLSAGMSITWGDYNNDGRMDAYVSNMYSSAGNRIAYQRNFRDDMMSSDQALFQRHARGNTLFQNQATSFQDMSLHSGSMMGRWAWGAKFCDINCDGWLDIYVANGFISTDDTGDL